MKSVVLIDGHLALQADPGIAGAFIKGISLWRQAQPEASIGLRINAYGGGAVEFNIGKNTTVRVMEDEMARADAALLAEFERFAAGSNRIICWDGTKFEFTSSSREW